MPSATKATITTASAPVDEGGTVRWANWTEYLDYDEDTQENPTLVEFEKLTGIKVSHKETVLDNDEFTAPLLEKLQSKKDNENESSFFNRLR